ncbi:hypothetical protein [Limnoglobus roseus]|uniref:hypothetical protein n=1 Tax=Limnoglobus roseus TaxID=2598579 RepID=UPI0011EA7796|nr:hypothetical protein [Limnoglobus roseus]
MNEPRPSCDRGRCRNQFQHSAPCLTNSPRHLNTAAVPLAAPLATHTPIEIGQLHALYGNGCHHLPIFPPDAAEGYAGQFHQFPSFDFRGWVDGVRVVGFLYGDRVRRGRRAEEGRPGEAAGRGRT